MANWGSLKKIDGHFGYSIDPKSEIIYWRGTIRGKKLKISTKEKQISKARRVVDEFILSLTSENIEKSKREKKGITNPSLKDMFMACVNERLDTRAESTKKRYFSVWNIDLEPFWGDKNASDMTERNVRLFESYYTKNYNGKLFFTAHKNLTMLINYLHRDGYLKKKIKVNKLDPKKRAAFRVYSQAEQASLITKSVSDLCRLALVLYFDTGGRKMEILSLKWSSVDFNKKTIRLYSQKNKRHRVIPLTSRAFEFLKIASEGQNKKDYIFPMKKKSGHSSGQLFGKEWSKTKKISGVTGKARIHDIRHTFATKTARDGWPIPVACEFLDMSPDVYIKTYVHITIDDLEKHLKRSFE